MFVSTHRISGVAYIGIPLINLLTKQVYTYPQWCARRGTLQEELAMDIAKEIMKVTGAKDCGVYILQHTVVVKTEA